MRRRSRSAYLAGHGSSNSAQRRWDSAVSSEEGETRSGILIDHATNDATGGKPLKSVTCFADNSLTL
jgi:hypothetical protein